jgi:creatinine amidohydrolase
VRYWGDLKSSDFNDLDPEATIAILPIAAIEQHGPHLPVSVDTTVMNGMLDALMAAPSEGLDGLVLPTLAVAKSNEHSFSPGTLTLGAETAFRSWLEIGESVRRTGVRKLVMVTSHGGNLDLMNVVARELRVRHRMLSVVTSWRRFGTPKGIFGDMDVAHGIHAGEIETSIMLHLRPDLVDMSLTECFTPVMVGMQDEFRHLRPTGNHAFGWIAQDIHPRGAAGDAAKASAAKGAETVAHQIAGFIELLRDVRRFSLDRLWQPAAEPGAVHGAAGD